MKFSRISIRISILILFNFFIFCSVNSQDLEYDKIDNLYVRAFMICLDTTPKYYKNIQTNRDYKNVIVKKDYFITDSLPNKYADFSIKVFDENMLRKELIDKKHRFPIFVIRPLVAINDTLEIDITDYWISNERDDFMYELEGGIIIKFVYDCILRRYKLVKVEFWGI